MVEIGWQSAIVDGRGPRGRAHGRLSPVVCGRGSDGGRDRDRALAMLGLSQRGSQLRAAIKRVGTFAGLDLDEFTGQLEARGCVMARAPLLSGSRGVPSHS